MIVPSTRSLSPWAWPWARGGTLFLLISYLFAVLLNAAIISGMLMDSKGVFPDDLCEQLGTREPVPEGLVDTRPLGWSCGLRVEVLPAFLFVVPLFFLPALLPLVAGVAMVGRQLGRRTSRLQNGRPFWLAGTRRVLLVLVTCYALSFLVNLLVLLAPSPDAACDTFRDVEALFGFLGVIYFGIACELYWGDPLGPLDPVYLLFIRPVYFAPLLGPAGYLVFLLARRLLRLRGQP